MFKKPEDFQEVYELYLKDVYRYCCSLTHDTHLAEELTQDTFFKALRGFPKFKGSCKINVWLFQIAKNTYFSHVKYQKRFVDSETVPESAHSFEGLEEHIVKQEKIFALHMLLHALPEPYKEVFHLRTFGELSFEQIGKLFDKTESWARVTYYRSRQKLQHKMKEDENL